jgi:phage terminase large subunit-like protein
MEQARPEQLPPEDFSWAFYFYLAGRGAGKTRTAAEWICHQAIFNADARYAIVAPTMQDAIQTCVEGESGILSILNRYQVTYVFIKSQFKIVLQNASQIFLYSAEEPNRLRGPQFNGAWLDELAAYSNPDALYDILLPSLRLGEKPQCVITTTPKPIPLIKSLRTKENSEKIVVRGSTFDNEANLPKSFISILKERFDGTRQGKQELYGELLDETEGALFDQKTIDVYRYGSELPSPTCFNKVLAIDPAVTWNENSAETGIIVAGMTIDGDFWVLEDGTLKGPPIAWATKAVELYKKHNCTVIVVETNNGGDLILDAIRQVDQSVRIKKTTGSTSKESRFSPLSIMYEKGLVHHVGQFYELEGQMTSWVPEISRRSPDRLDALAWAIEELQGGSNGLRYLYTKGAICQVCNYPNVKSHSRCTQCNNLLSKSVDNF